MHHTLVCTICGAELKLPIVDNAVQVSDMPKWTFNSDDGWRCIEHSSSKAVSHA